MMCKPVGLMAVATMKFSYSIASAAYTHNFKETPRAPMYTINVKISLGLLIRLPIVILPLAFKHKAFIRIRISI